MISVLVSTNVILKPWKNGNRYECTIIPSFDPLAQLVEQRLFNPLVPGAEPGGITTLL